MDNEFLQKIKQDIKDFKEEKINRLPLTEDYCNEFKFSPTKIKNLIKENISEEDREFRLKIMRSQIGKETFQNLPEEKKEEQRQRFSELQKKNMENANLSEELQKLVLETEGWEVERHFKKEKTNEGWRSVFRFLELQEFLNDIENGEELLDKLLDLRMNKIMLPDFICKKNGKIKLVEVKNMKEFNPNEKQISQQEAIEELYELGFEVELINLNINKEEIDKKIEEFVLKTGETEGHIVFKQNEEGELFIKIMKAFYCVECNRRIKQRGKCLICNVKAKRENKK